LDTLIWIFWNANERRLRCGYRLLLQIVATLILLIGIIMVAAVLVQQFLPGSETFVFGTIQQFVVATTVVLACLFLDRRKLSSLGIRFNGRWWIDLIAGLVMGAGMMTLIFVIEYQLGWIELEERARDWGKLVPTLLGWFGLFVCVGIVEEVFSRGYHLKNLSEGFSRLGKLPSFLLATVISSGIFGLLHAMNPNADLISIASICLAGVMFCIGRLCTGSLAAPIGLHITWNFFQGPVYGFAVSGNTTDGSIMKVKSATNELWTGGEFGPEAGLMGIIAILLMTAMYLAWPRDSSENRVQRDLGSALTGDDRVGTNLAQLADFDHCRMRKIEQKSSLF